MLDMEEIIAQEWARIGRFTLALFSLVLFSGCSYSSVPTTAPVANTVAPTQGDPAAYHEFEMFGNKKIYLSHYSMFHAIHSYQVILEASFLKGNVDVAKAFSEDRKNHPEREYTLSPSKVGSPFSRRRDDWSLPDYIQTGKEFNADIHWGDKENEVLFSDVTVKIDRVIHFRRFEDADSRNTALSYILFGEKDDLYLAHLVSVFPDFDQIVAVDVVDGTVDSYPHLIFSVANTADDAKSRLKTEGEEVVGVSARLNPPRTLNADPRYPDQFVDISGKELVGEKANQNSLKLKVNSEVYFADFEEQL